MKTKITLAFLVASLAAIAQTSAPAVPQIATWYRFPGATAPYPYKWASIDPPLTLKEDAAGNPHLSCDVAPSIGLGLISVQVAGQPNYKIVVDGAVIPYRTDPPKGPGACDAYGEGAWASDPVDTSNTSAPRFFYFCTQNGLGTGFVWARIPMQTTW